MRIRYIGMLGLVATAALASDGPSFDKYPAFHIRRDCEISWASATNELPKALWIYKVVPQHFTASAISNLLALGNFSSNDERRKRGQIIITNNDPLMFVSQDKARTLTIVPSQGWIKYHDEYAPPNHYDKSAHRWQPVEGLPEGKALEEMALQFLQRLGIERADLATKPNSTDLLTFGVKRTRSYFDRDLGKDIEDEQFYRGLFFPRRIDGVNFAGIGTGAGCQVCFGNHAKVADLEVVWRNLQHHERRRTVNADQMIRYIREGQAVMTHRDLMDAAQLTRLTIKEVAPMYMGAVGESEQHLVYPFAQLEAIANLGATNSPLQLYCPVLTDEKFHEGAGE